MSKNTARKYRDANRLPNQMKPRRTWRTRTDPFEEAWGEVEELLLRAPGLQVKTIFWVLCRKYPENFKPGQIRTLQRRIRKWRALHGPEKEVFFDQVHRPGEFAQSDFTDVRDLKIRIAGEPFPHLLYHFVLPFSGWEDATICFSESFAALSTGLQNALWKLGGAPEKHRTDNLSAATHDLRKSQGRTFNRVYRDLVDHYRMKPSRNAPRKPNQNGSVEQAHYRLETEIDQRLLLRGDRNFPSRQTYREFLENVLTERNYLRRERLTEDLSKLKPLPRRRLDDFHEVKVKVRRGSNVWVLGNVYSVPSTLRGEKVTARIRSEEIEIWLGSEFIQRMPRLRGNGNSLIDYRHIISSLVKKPGAFERYKYREAMFPREVFRRAYDVLLEHSKRWPDLEYLRILNLAKETLESEVGCALELLLAQDQALTFEAVRALVTSDEPRPVPEVDIPEPCLVRYDRLCGEVAA